jgi:hypothetical protein
LHPAQEELVEQLAGLKRGVQLGKSHVAAGGAVAAVAADDTVGAACAAAVAAGGAVGAAEHTAALTPQAQVIDRAQGITGVRVAPLFRRVDEVQGHVPGDERDLGD